jgi:serine/threonine protein kinase
MAAEADWWADARRYLSPEQCDDIIAGEEPLPTFLTPSDDPTKLGRFGPYEISEVIGRGGMGVVLKGFDAELNRYVALKVLAPQWAASGAARRRFAREAQAAAAVVHEHVVAIHSVNSAGGLPYLVMRFVPGDSLERRIRREGPLEVREILRIGMQTAAGLAAAHAQGLVHRDVKPANILLERDVQRVLITDFGLARAVDDASLTQSGVVAGTPQYMAPEQAQGQPIDHRADLFSLGGVIYAMCTGHSPFRAEMTLAVLRRICESKPRPIREINPEIPDWLAEIVDRLLEKDPQDRFQSAEEVADLLGRHLAHLQHPSAMPIPARIKSRSRSKLPAHMVNVSKVIGAVAVLLLGGLGAAKLVGITNLLEFTTGVFFGGATELSVPLTEEASSTAPDASAPAIMVVPSDLLHWDDGLEQRMDDVRRQIQRLEESPNPQGDSDQPPDASAVLDLELQELEGKVIDRWP